MDFVVDDVRDSSCWSGIPDQFASVTVNADFFSMP
jgi:hypothetical protein